MTVILVAANTQATAELSSPASLEELIDESSLVFTASIAELTFPTGEVIADLRVDRGIKGNPPQRVAAVLEATLSTRGLIRGEYRTSQASIQGKRGLFFARTGADGRIRVFSATNGMSKFADAVFLMPSQSLPPSRRPGDTLDDLMVREFAVHVEALSPERASEFRRTGVTLVSAFAAMKRGQKSSALREVAESWWSSPRLELNALGLAILIARNDPLGVIRYDQVRRRLTAGLDRAVYPHIRAQYSNPDPDGVRAIDRILQGVVHEEALNSACTTALMNIHSRESVPVLIKQLDHPSPSVRALAVRGLGMFAGGYAPGRDVKGRAEAKYRSEETDRFGSGDRERMSSPAYAAFWKQWWATHRAELTGPR